MLSRMLNASRQYAGINNVEELGKSKEATQLYQALERNEAVISQLGYREMPEDIYNELLKEHEFKGRIQDSLKIDGKQKRSLFIEHYSTISCYEKDSSFNNYFGISTFIEWLCK